MNKAINKSMNEKTKLFDSFKGKYVTNNEKNRRRLKKQGDLFPMVKSSTFMTRFHSKLDKLKLGNTVHLSIHEIKAHFKKECLIALGMNVLNT